MHDPEVNELVAETRRHLACTRCIIERRFLTDCPLGNSFCPWLQQGVRSTHREVDISDLLSHA